jgi:hypothetical protein
MNTSDEARLKMDISADRVKAQCQNFFSHAHSYHKAIQDKDQALEYWIQLNGLSRAMADVMSQMKELNRNWDVTENS